MFALKPLGMNVGRGPGELFIIDSIDDDDGDDDDDNMTTMAMLTMMIRVKTVMVNLMMMRNIFKINFG